MKLKVQNYCEDFNSTSNNQCHERKYSLEISDSDYGSLWWRHFRIKGGEESEEGEGKAEAQVPDKSSFIHEWCTPARGKKASFGP